jgi:rubredoxin
MEKAVVRYKPNPKEIGDVVPEICCPQCSCELEYFSGLEQIPEYLYCPVCNDTAYDVFTGLIIGRLE